MSLTAVWDSSPYDAEERAKIRGQRRASSARHRDLALARSIARELAQDGRVLCADDIRFEALRRPELGIVWANFAGSIFTGPEWAFVGYTQSTAPGRRASAIKTWRLK